MKKMATISDVKNGFSSLVKTAEPPVLSAFVIWLDMRLAEFKVFGSFRLDIDGDSEVEQSALSPKEPAEDTLVDITNAEETGTGLKIPCQVNEHGAKCEIEEPTESANNLTPSVHHERLVVIEPISSSHAYQQAVKCYADSSTMNSSNVLSSLHELFNQQDVDSEPHTGKIPVNDVVQNGFRSEPQVTLNEVVSRGPDQFTSYNIQNQQDDYQTFVLDCSKTNLQEKYMSQSGNGTDNPNSHKLAQDTGSRQHLGTDLQNFQNLGSRNLTDAPSESNPLQLQDDVAVVNLSTANLVNYQDLQEESLKDKQQSAPNSQDSNAMEIDEEQVNLNVQLHKARAIKRGPPKLIAIRDEEEVEQWFEDNEMPSPVKQNGMIEMGSQRNDNGTDIALGYTSVSPESDNGVDLSSAVQVNDQSSVRSEHEYDKETGSFLKVNNTFYKCQLCGKILLTIAGCRRHLHTHAGDTPEKSSRPSNNESVLIKESSKQNEIKSCSPVAAELSNINGNFSTLRECLLTSPTRDDGNISHSPKQQNINCSPLNSHGTYTVNILPKDIKNLQFPPGILTSIANVDTDIMGKTAELSCPICKRPFLHLSSLNRHLKVHQGIYTHACAVCGRRFTRNEHFVQHKCCRRPKNPNRMVQRDEPLEGAAKLVAFPPSMAMALVEEHLDQQTIPNYVEQMHC